MTDQYSYTVNAQGEAGRDASHVPNPQEFRSDRRSQSATSRPMQPFSDGIHHCFGREIAITFVCEMIKLVAGLKDLRPAPGLSGQIKAIQLGTEKCFLNNTWSYLTFDPTSAYSLPPTPLSLGTC